MMYPMDLAFEFKKENNQLKIITNSNRLRNGDTYLNGYWDSTNLLNPKIVFQDTITDIFFKIPLVIGYLGEGFKKTPWTVSSSTLPNGNYKVWFEADKLSERFNKIDMDNNLIQNIERMSRDSRWSQESFKKVKLTLEELNKIAHDECSKFKELLGDDFDQAVINIRDLLANDGARTVGKSISAVDDSFKPWVKSRIATTETPHWNKYKVELQRDYPSKVAQSTDDNTTEILDMLGNPKETFFNKRGLVMGSVQMGKTLNYIGLISKAADFGYKFIIIIAGATNNLRTQTQSRVDEGFTRVDSGSSQIMTPEIYGNQPMSLTNLVNDFNKVKRGDDFNLLQSDRPYIAVVKKNGTVLKNLLNWIVDAHFLEGHSKSNPTQGGPLDIPLLLIDDEADYASVNTAKDPKKMTKINETIRQILSKFSKSSYIGYTATPFANIFIDPYKDVNEEIGDDLFPKNFIYKLGLPSNYMGPDTFFGDKANDSLIIDLEIDHPKTMDFHIVKDRSDKDNPVFQVNGITDDLKAAIRNFILIVVERKLRGHLNKHNTMMINFQYLTVLQDLLKGHVKSYLDELTDSCVAWNSLSIDRALEDPNIKDLFDYELNTDSVVMTNGKSGGTYYNGIDTVKYRSYSQKTFVDSIGAGDTFFAFSSVLLHSNNDMAIKLDISSLFASLTTQWRGNQNAISKSILKKYNVI